MIRNTQASCVNIGNQVRGGAGNDKIKGAFGRVGRNINLLRKIKEVDTLLESVSSVIISDAIMEVEVTNNHHTTRLKMQPFQDRVKLIKTSWRGLMKVGDIL